LQFSRFVILHAMSISQWEVKTFQQLTVDQLFEVLQLRVDVFVVEQQCAYPELDHFDRHAETRHLSGRDECGQLMAYARILPPGLKFSEVSIGRFVVKGKARGKGVGHELFHTVLAVIQKCWPGNAIRISAQEYLQKFYAQHGFTRVSDVYLEDGIPHFEMLRKSSRA
jgi:ElaA protein